MLLNIFSISKFDIPTDIFTEILVTIGIKVYISTETTTAIAFFLLKSFFLICVYAVGTISVGSFIMICPSSVFQPSFP